MVARDRRRPLWHALKVLTLALLRAFAWTGLGALASLAKTPFGAAGALFVMGLFAWHQRIWGARKTMRALAAMRLRPLRSRWLWLLGTVAALVAVQFGYVLLLARSDHLESAGSWATSTSVALLVLTIPFIEEVSFRGWALRQLESDFGRVRAMVLTASVFAVFHFQFVGIPIRFLLAMVAGLAMYTTRSLWAAVLVHVIYNSVAVSITRTNIDFVLLVSGPWSRTLTVGILAVGGAGLALAYATARRLTAASSA